MKRTTSGFKIHRTSVIGLVVFVAIATLLVLAVSAKRARQRASLFANVASPHPANSVRDAALKNTQGKKPLAPTAAVIVATLSDNVTAATRIVPGANIL